MDDDDKIDDISEISDKVSNTNNNKKNNYNNIEVVKHNFYQKKEIMNKKPTRKINTHRSRSVALDERNKEINKKRYNDEEEQKNNNKKTNKLIKSGKITKIFLKNKDYLLRTLNIIKNNSKKNNNKDNNSIDLEKNDDIRRKQNNFKFRRNNSCIDLRPKKRKKISVTCLKFASNVAKDNDGLILFENGTGVNNCFLNAITQVLYHLESFRDKLMEINIKREIKDPIFQLYTIFASYNSLSKLNTIEMLNTTLLRRALHSKFGTYQKGKFGDPIETILELLELIHKEYFGEKENENKKNTNTFCKNELCPSHSNFLLYLKEIKFCPTCKALKVQNYDKDCFMFTISIAELLISIDEKDQFSKYKYSLFKKAKYLSQRFGQDDKIRLDKCKCRSVATRKRLYLYKKCSPYLIINMTWNSDFPRITNICKILGLIPHIDNNKNLFDLDLEKGKKKKEDLSTDYYLSSMILFGQRHYTCFFYNKEIKMWSFADDEKKKNFNTYNELIVYIISRRSFPVGIFYTSVNIFKNEPKEKYALTEEQYNEIYQNCLIEEQVEIEENEKFNKMLKEKNSIINENRKEKEKESKEESKNDKKKKDDDDGSDISF